MARRPSVEFPAEPTKLGRAIEHHLEKSGHTLAEFIRELAKAVPGFRTYETLISKYVAHGRPIPKPDFIRAVSIVLHITEESALELARRADSEVVEVKPFQLLMGHTIWSAPFVLAAMEGSLPGFEVATFATAEGNLDFIDSKKWKDHTREGWSAADLKRPSVPFSNRAGMAQPPGDLIPLSAVTACELFRDRQEIDAVVIPGALAEQQTDELFRVACVAETDKGLVLVCKKELADELRKDALCVLDENADGARNSPTAGRAMYFPPQILAERLVSILRLKKRDRWVVALEQGTIGDKVMHAGCEVHFPNEGEERAGSFIFPFPTAELATTSFSKLAAKKETRGRQIMGVVTWDPMANWLMQRSHDEDRQGARCGGEMELQIFSLEFPPDLQPDNPTFDVCIRREVAMSQDARSADLRRALAELPKALARYCSGLDRIGQRSNPGKKRADVHQLAKLSNYFAIRTVSNKSDAREIPDEIFEEQPEPESLAGIRAALAPLRFRVGKDGL